MNIKISMKLCMSSKSWAMFMGLTNLALGIFIIVGGSVWLAHNQVLETFKTYFACGVLVGILNIFAGCILIFSMIQGKEHSVLLYILLEFIILFILSIFTAMNIYDEFSVVTMGLACSCPILWLGLYNIYGFYLELNNYNNSSVQAGVDNIACNTYTDPLTSFPERALDTTSV